MKDARIALSLAIILLCSLLTQSAAANAQIPQISDANIVLQSTKNRVAIAVDVRVPARASVSKLTVWISDKSFDFRRIAASSSSTAMWISSRQDSQLLNALKGQKAITTKAVVVWRRSRSSTTQSSKLTTSMNIEEQYSTIAH